MNNSKFLLSSVLKNFIKLLLICTLLKLIACNNNGTPSQADNQTAETQNSPLILNAAFSDQTNNAGIRHAFFINDPDSTSDPAKMGGGLSAVDFDLDGDIDIYLVGGDGEPNALFVNQGNNQFENLAEMLNLDLTHLGSGPVFADIDNDQDLDLFIGAVEGDKYYLLRNEQGAYTDITQNSGLTITADNTISASFADYDQDNDLDLLLAHWGNAPQLDSETLWQNHGDGTFTSASIISQISDQMISDQGGLQGFFDYSFAGIFSDIDGDRDLDILMSSDFRTSKVFKNNGDGTFSNITDIQIILDQNGMGNAVGDYDNDGDMDWFVSSIYEDPETFEANIGNRLYQNQGDGSFIDVTDTAGVADGGWAWGSCMQDFDNDGDLDIFHVNGWLQFDPRTNEPIGDYLYDRLRYFESQGDGTFIETALSVGLTDEGLGRGAACFDADRDGDLDIVITNNGILKSVIFYRNDLNNNNAYLTVKLRAASANRFAIGARITVSSGELTQIREIRAGNNYVSQSPLEAHFGLAKLTTVDIQVDWPDGDQSFISDVAVNQVLTITQEVIN